MSNYTLSKRDKSYRDVSLAFKPNPLTGDLTLLQNERAINNSLKNIVMTLPSEVAFQRDFGCTVQNSLFYNINDSAMEGLLCDEIKRAIIFNEPRVTFNNPVDGEVAAESYADASAKDPYDVVTDNSFISDKLGVSVSANLDTNGVDVTIKYRIVGSVQIFEVTQILTPTR